MAKQNQKTKAKKQFEKTTKDRNDSTVCLFVYHLLRINVKLFFKSETRLNGLTIKLIFETNLVID